MASDAPPGHYAPPQGISIALGLNDSARGEEIFNKLAEGGTVQLPYSATFWAKGFGMCVDRFGIPWMVNCE
jgi:PhnB protein